MSGGRAEIPDVQGIDQKIARILQPMRQMLHSLTGRVDPGPIQQLGPTATTADCINKINEIIVRLNQ